MVFNNHYSEKKLKAYDFQANLLWESNVSCYNMIMDEQALYCEDTITTDTGISQSKLLKIDLANGDVVAEATFPRFDTNLYENDSALFVNINGWSEDGSAKYSFIKIDKNTLDKEWSVDEKNIVGIDAQKGFLYSYYFGTLSAYSADNGSKVFDYKIPNMQSQNFLSLTVSDDSSIVIESALNGYRYDLLTY